MSALRLIRGGADPAEQALELERERLAQVEREEEQIRQLWRWAAWACPDGIPTGWSEKERPR